MSFTVRPMTKADAAAYREIRLEALQHHPEAYAGDYESAAAYPHEHWENRLAAGRSFGAEADGSLIGIMAYTVNDAPKLRHIATLVNVYTKPAWRGKGVADALIKATLQQAATEVEQVLLGVEANNTPARALYERHGFTVYGMEPRATKVGTTYYDLHLMVKALVK